MCDIKEFKRRVDAGHDAHSAGHARILDMLDDKEFAKEYAMKSGIWTEDGELHPNYKSANGTNYTRGPGSKS